MNILITGGLGYIGSYLMHHLSATRMCVVDNMFTQRYCSLLNRKTNIEFIEDDFINLSVDKIRQFDLVIHLAAIVDAANSFQNKDIIEKVNVRYTKEFIEKCAQAEVKLIFPSSTSVYGTSKDEVFESDNDVINPQSPYAEAKVEVEQFIQQIHSDYMILRLGTVCGISPGIRFQTAINKFCFQATFHQPLTIWKQNYEMVRPYLVLLHLKDILEKLIWRWSDRNHNIIYNVVTSNKTLKYIINSILCYKPYTQLEFTECPLLNQYSYRVNHKLIEDVTDIKSSSYSINTSIQIMLKYLEATRAIS